MKRSFILVSAVFSMFFAVSCSSAPKAEAPKSTADAEIEMIEKDNAGKELVIVQKLSGLKEKHGDKITQAVEKNVKNLLSSISKHNLDSFKNSPNKEIQVPSDKSRIHIKNDYTGGNLLVIVSKSGDASVMELVPNNSEKSWDLNPGSYDFTIIIDRKFSDFKNKYALTSQLSLEAGQLYIGNFKVKGQPMEGSCAENTIKDDADCLVPTFEIFDNCTGGQSLVDGLLCCDGDKNFIVDNQCSRHPGYVENVVCPKGTKDMGGGRCCPDGTELIDGQCQTPKKKDEKKGKK